MKEKLRRLSGFLSGLVFVAIVLSLAAFSVETKSVVDVKVIYGPDDRQDVYEVTNPDLLFISQATVAILEDYEITDNGDDTYDLNTIPYANYLNFCEGEPFVNQPTAGFCSGFLVAPDIIATAGHCIGMDENCAAYQARCEELRFVFGFQMTDASTAVTTLPEEDVYSCKPGDGLIDCVYSEGAADWALIRLDRPVVSRTPLPVRRSGTIAEQTPVGVGGHPATLPQKIAVNAEVRSVETEFFVANLDTYGGNSGSPVFNTNDYVVEGILVRGEVDYVYQSQGCEGGCFVSNTCPDTGCRGEDVTKTTEFADLIMAQIPAGCFDMGDAFGEGYSDELPVHEVCISAFEMDVSEVTNAKYAKCVDAGACSAPAVFDSYTRASYYGNPVYDDYPVIHVSWYQAKEYCTWVGKRLPTEALWEYAARGGLVGKRYPWGDTLSGADANYRDSGDPEDNDTNAVGSYPANGYGLYDMTGNVEEWVEDDYHGSYDCDANPGAFNCGGGGIAPTDGSAWVDDPRGTMRPMRGGAWSHIAIALRVAHRSDYYPSNGLYDVGFRCARGGALGP